MAHQKGQQTQRSLLGLATMALLLIAGSQARADFTYTVTDLGTLGGRSSQAIGVSQNGLVVGDADTSSGQQHAFLYQNGVMQDLGTLGGAYSIAYAVNNVGQVVGYSQTATGDTHAFLYQNGMMTDLGTFFGGSTSYAFGINQSGQVTGVGYLPGNTGTAHAFLYSPGGSVQDLGTLGGNYSEGRAINDLGQVAGDSGTGTGGSAFVYSGGVMSNLGTTPGTSATQVYGMNNVGQVVGTGYTVPTVIQRPELYTPGFGWQDLGTLGGSSGQAFGVNDLGQVVGESQLQGNNLSHAFLYQGGVLTDLNSLIPTNSGWDLTEAFAINNAGVIVGDGGGPAGNYEHAFMLTPVPEPTSIILLGIGMAVLTCFGWRQRIIQSESKR